MIDLLDPLVLIVGLHQNLTSKPIVPKGAMSVYPDLPCAHEIFFDDASKLRIIEHPLLETLSSSEGEESIFVSESTLSSFSSSFSPTSSPIDSFHDLIL